MKLTYYLILWLLSIVGYGLITLDNGQYKDLYITIQDNVTANEEILTRIQTIFTEASQRIFEATNQRAFFKQIKIVIPNTWPSNIAYTSTPSLGNLDSYITIADGLVSDPHVNRLTSECGAEGKYMYLSTDFILTEGITSWGPHANVIVHEWGHLRWGLFDEYPSEQNKFYGANGRWNVNRCTEAIQGTVGAGTYCNDTVAVPCDLNDSTKPLPSYCNFCVDPSQDTKASLMGYQFIERMSSFCDESSAAEELRHNKDAINKQNTFCNRQSAWEVMRNHGDFYLEANPSLPTNTDTTPEFVLLQETALHIVLVLDVSGSMASNRIANLKTVCEHFIQNVVERGSLVGVVWFSSSASIKKYLTQVNSQHDRDGLIASLPSTVGGSTCIGCGIDSALTVLKEILSNPEYGQIIIVSDGYDNQGNLDDSIQEAKSAKIVVNTIAITKNADPQLRSVAEDTGGRHLTYLDLLNIGISLREAFGEILSTGVTTMSSAAATILSEIVYATANETTSFEFMIDSGIGINTTISILTGSTTYIKFKLTGPNGYTENSDKTDNSFTLTIPGQAEAGQYHINITLSANITLECSVTSKPVSSGPGVIRLLTKLSTSTVKITSSYSPLPVMYASVIMNFAPVINAKLTAKIASEYRSCNVNLLDDGNDPDIVRDDGTYSGYIQLNCMSNGAQATIKVLASADGNASLGSVNSGSYRNTGSDTTSGGAVDGFQRVALPGDLYIIMQNIDTSVDITAPGRITNLQIVDVSTVSTTEGENRNYTITWTATGDDMNVGQATSYELRISENSSTLMDNFTSVDFLNIKSAIPTPLASGETEALKMVVDAKERYLSTAYIAIIAIDNEGNRGNVSNIVSINIASGYKIAVTVAIAEQDNIVGDDRQYSPSQTSTSESSATTVILIAVIVPVCLILVFVFGGVLVYKKKFRKDNNSTRDAETGPCNTSYRTRTVSYKSNSAGSPRSGTNQTKTNIPFSARELSTINIETPLFEPCKLNRFNHPLRKSESAEILSLSSNRSQQDKKRIKTISSNRITPTPEPQLSTTADDLQSLNSTDECSDSARDDKLENKRIKRLNSDSTTPEPILHTDDDVFSVLSLDSFYSEPDEEAWNTCDIGGDKSELTLRTIQCGKKVMQFPTTTDIYPEETDTEPSVPDTPSYNIPFHLTNKVSMSQSSLESRDVTGPHDGTSLTLPEGLPALPSKKMFTLESDHPPPNFLSIKQINPSRESFSFQFPAPFSGMTHFNMNPHLPDEITDIGNINPRSPEIDDSGQNGNDTFDEDSDQNQV